MTFIESKTVETLLRDVLCGTVTYYTTGGQDPQEHSLPAATFRAPRQRVPGGLHPTSPRRRFLTVHAARPCPRSWWTLSFNASISSSGGGGLRSALAASSSSVSSGRRRPDPRPRIARASSNLFDARRSKGVPTSVTSKRAVRLLRASPRSATPTMTRSRSRRCSVTASGVPPLAQECMRCGDTPKSCPSSAQVNPPMRRNSEIARRVVSPGSVVPNRVTNYDSRRSRLRGGALRCSMEIPIGLQPDPELRGCLQEARQPQGRIRRARIGRQPIESCARPPA